MDMYSDQYFSYLTQNKDILDRLQRTPHHPDSIHLYRTEMETLLQEMLQHMDTAPSADAAETEALRKLVLQICCRICETRIADEKREGCRIVTADVTPESLRSSCVQCYDTQLAVIRETNRMFLPDIIERTAPDRDQKRALLRRYDQQARQIAGQSQANNKNLNRLFGSRG